MLHYSSLGDTQYMAYNTSQPQSQHQQQHISCSPYMNELNCSTNAYYEYDYTGNSGANTMNTSVPMMSQSQQASPFYVYHHHNQQQQFTDYASPNSLAPMASPPQTLSQFGTSTTPTTSNNANSNTSSTSNGNYYPNYTNVPYMPYDPSVAPPPQTSYSNMLYSPMHSTAPACSPLTSPQQNQATSLLASYQTPPQAQHHHQLYISAGDSSSTAPNSSSSTNISTGSSGSPTRLG